MTRSVFSQIERQRQAKSTREQDPKANTCAQPLRSEEGLN